MGLGDEAVNAKIVQTEAVVNLAMNSQTVLPIGSNIPVLVVRTANAQWVDYRAAGESIYMGHADAVAKYGSYDAKGRWANENRWITDYHIPKDILNDPNYNWRWAKDLGGSPVTHFYVNRDIVPALTNALKNLQQAGHLGDLRTFDGAFVARNMRGSSQISAHAYGLALDINADTMPRGSRALQPLHLRTSFMRAGFVDGGTWAPPWAIRDPMHFTVGF
jgi:hypothetical protein